VIIYLRPTAVCTAPVRVPWARDPERRHMRSQPAQGPRYLYCRCPSTSRCARVPWAWPRVTA
jgi:hypothetical protein